MFKTCMWKGGAVPEKNPCKSAVGERSVCVKAWCVKAWCCG